MRDEAADAVRARAEGACEVLRVAGIAQRTVQPCTRGLEMCGPYLTKPEMNTASGTIARPRGSFANVRSMVAMMFAAASHMLDSANACPGQMLSWSRDELSPQ